jgi:peptidoglycan/LPS O-acetylase OafA/YrhL
VGKTGAYAVDAFVILSGFVITRLLLSKNEPYGVFIVRRFMRLFPAFAFCLALALLVRPFTLGTVQTEFIRETSETNFFWWHIGAHVSLLHGLVPTLWLPESHFAFLRPGWSISLEFQLYLVAPLALWFITRFGFKGFAFLGVTSAILPEIFGRLDYIWANTGAFLPQRFLFFVFGMMLCFLSNKAKKPVGAKGTWQGFVRLGEVSYSTYLVHWSILACLNVLLPGSWTGFLRAAVLFITGAPLILLASLILYRFVERPGIALGRYLTKPRRDTVPYRSAPISDIGQSQRIS